MAIEARDERAGIIDRLAELSAATLSECLDDMGLWQQVMAPRIRPLHPAARAVGVAATVEAIEVEVGSEDHDYRGPLEAIHQLGPGDVLVVSTVNGNFLGEHMVKASQQRGAAGIVMDAWAHDAAGIVAAAFPTFVAAISPLDYVGRHRLQEPPGADLVRWSSGASG